MSKCRRIKIKRKQTILTDFARFENQATKLSYITEPLARVHNFQCQM